MSNSRTPSGSLYSTHVPPALRRQPSGTGTLKPTGSVRNVHPSGRPPVVAEGVGEVDALGEADGLAGGSLGGGAAGSEVAAGALVPAEPCGVSPPSSSPR